MTPDMINRIVEHEGWKLYDIDAVGLYQIQRSDNMQELPDDVAAFRHVRAYADAGSWVHKQALETHRAYVPLIVAYNLKRNP